MDVLLTQSLNISIDPSHPPPTPGLCVGMYSTCEVHAKYALMQGPDAPRHHYRPTLRGAEGSKWPKFNDIFEPKKKFNDSAPSIDGALNLLMNKNQAKAEVRCGELFLWNSFNVKDFWLLWESHSPCLLVSHLNTQRNFLSECVSVLWVSLWMILPRIFERGFPVGSIWWGGHQMYPIYSHAANFRQTGISFSKAHVDQGFFCHKMAESANPSTATLFDIMIFVTFWHIALVIQQNLDILASLNSWNKSDDCSRHLLG